MKSRSFSRVAVTSAASLAVACLVLVACGGQAPPGGGPGGTDVRVELAKGRAVTATLPAGGGVIAVTGADGTVYTLSVPAGALLEATTMTMTPVAAVTGAPVTGAGPRGVQLAPDGLRLYRAATLDVSPPEGAAAKAAAYTYQGDGEGFHGYPLAPDPDTLTLDLLHFSGYVVYLGPALEAGPVDAPSDPEAQLEQSASELLKAERDARLAGDAGYPDLAGELEELLRSHYRQFVAPLLGVISTDCQAARLHADEALAWTRLTHVLGLAEEFAAENQAVWDSIIEGLEECWEEVAEPCIEPGDAEQMQAALLIARQLALLGVAPGKHDPLDPATHCAGTWSGTITYVHEGSVTWERSEEWDEGSNSRTFERRQTITVSGAMPDKPGRVSDLHAVLDAEGRETFDSYGMIHRWDDCVASAPDILRYVIEESMHYAVGGSLHEEGELVTVYIEYDGTYSLRFAVPSLELHGTRTRHSYYIDNCHPDSEQDETTTEDVDTFFSAAPEEVSGPFGGEEASLSGSLSRQSVYENVPTTLTITWDLKRDAR